MAEGTQEKDVLAFFYQSWQEYQDKLLVALQPLTEQQLSLRPAPNLRTIHDTITHIIGARVRWYNGALHEGTAEIVPLGQWDRLGQPTRTTQELVDGLHRSWQLMRESMDRWTPDDMAEEVKATWHGEDVSYTRQAVVWHVLEHDLHHGGEFSLTLGIHGLTAPDL